MKVNRGDVALARVPFASGQGSKSRPCIVVQNDQDNAKLANTVVVWITTNLARQGDKSHFLVEVSTADGQQTGLLHDSVVSCNNVATIEESLIHKRLGTLSPALLARLEGRLKAALELS